MIPKIIHQTWKTREIPHQWQSAVQSCKALHPDYEYILWTHETMAEFVKTEYPDFLQTYTGYKYDIQRCDAFRYLVLYKYGGIYLDLDMICKKKLDGLLTYDFVLGKSLNTSSSYASSYANCFFMVIPQHPFIKFCIEQLPHYAQSFVYFGKHLHIMNSAGPLFLTKMIAKYKNIPNMYVLTQTEFAGDCNVCNFNKCQSGTYFNHFEGNSTWNSWDSTFYNAVFCNYKWILAVVIIFCGGGWIYKKKKGKLRVKLGRKTKY
jgi:mannosyltransferase OCH1-like enzyme